MHIGKPEITSLEAVCQLGVVEGEQLQDGGVEIVHMHRIFYRVETQFVAFAQRDAGINSTLTIKFTMAAIPACLSTPLLRMPAR